MLVRNLIILIRCFSFFSFFLLYANPSARKNNQQSCGDGLDGYTSWRMGTIRGNWCGSLCSGVTIPSFGWQQVGVYSLVTVGDFEIPLLLVVELLLCPLHVFTDRLCVKKITLETLSIYIEGKNGIEPVCMVKMRWIHETCEQAVVVNTSSKEKGEGLR